MKLNDGRSMPEIGLGLMRFGAEAETQGVIARAVDAGYRLFDTAAVYGTEVETGEALRGAGVPREELFVTTKLWNEDQGRATTPAAFDASLDRLGLDYIDLYLIHWPTPMFDLYVETWQALIALRDGGRVKSIGVSNFQGDHIERLVAETGVAPAVNQVEMHPYFQQTALRACHARHGVVTQAWSPFGGGGRGTVPLQDDPAIIAIARKHGATPTQAVLAWHVAQGASAIPKATSAAHLQQNLAAGDLVLDAADLAALAALDRPDGRVGGDPDTMSLRKLTSEMRRE